MTDPATPPPEDRRGLAAARAGRFPAMRVVALLVGAVVAVAVLGVSSYAVANLLVRTTETGGRTLTGEVVRAEIRVDGSVSVEAGRGDRAVVHRRSTFGLRRPTVRQTLVDGLLTVRVSCGGLVVLCTNDVTVEVPASASVDVEGIDDVDVTDIDGTVEIDSGAGGVTLTRLTGRVVVNNGAGSIVGRALESSEVEAHVGAGSVELTFTTSPMKVVAASGAGSVIVEVPREDVAYRVSMVSGAGNPTNDVRTDPTSERHIEASNGAGDVHVRYAR